jgi:hypothetical protein
MGSIELGWEFGAETSRLTIDIRLQRPRQHDVRLVTLLMLERNGRDIGGDVPTRRDQDHALGGCAIRYFG